jgi:hypothetical protein
MFYTLHRAMKFTLFCVFLFVAWKVYEHRRVFQPALIWYDVWDNGGFKQPPLRQVDGRVEKVLTSQVFMLAATNAARFNVRLMGLADPSTTSAGLCFGMARISTRTSCGIISPRRARSA